MMNWFMQFTRCRRPRFRRAVSRFVLVVVVLIPVVCCPGCYHYRVTAPQPDPATQYERRMVQAFLWGMLQQDTRALDCKSNALDEVRVTTNLGYLLASVLTLGIWAPMDVEWRCAKPPVREGVL